MARGMAPKVLSHLDKALLALEEAASAAETTGDLLTLSSALMNAIWIHSRRGAFELARKGGDPPLGALTPNRQKFLAHVGKKSTNQALQRVPAVRRYLILLAFLRLAQEQITDETVDLFDGCLAHNYNRAGHDLEEFRRTTARATNAKVVLFETMAPVVLGATIPDAELCTRILHAIPPERLRAELEETQRLMRTLDDNNFDFLTQRYAYLRQFTPELLRTLTFRAHQPGDPLVGALEAAHGTAP